MNRLSTILRFSFAYCFTLSVLILTVRVAACQADTWVTIKRVADGDTIILQDGRHVRYIGIDTPEIDHENQRAAPLGYEARAYNRQLVEGQDLRLMFDREKKDRYGRILAYVYRRDGLFVNLELLKKGYAYVMYHYPNTFKEALFLSAQRKAMQRGRGIWRKVKKDNKPSQAYLGNRRSKRFHAHNCPMAQKMSVKNRVSLNNRWDAFWSGYAPARECIDFPADN